MSTKQPKWICLANLGDMNPLDHGGEFVMMDQTGVYSPELWRYDADRRTLHTVQLDRLHVCPNDAGLGGNRYHVESPEWFAKPERLDALSRFADIDARALFLSSDPIDRAQAYLAAASYFGNHEFDSDPRQFETRTQARKFLPRRFL